MFKRILLGLVVGLFMLWSIGFAEEPGTMQKIINETKSWKYSLGDYCYLVKEGQSYYGIGISKDIGVYVERIGEDWVYADVGYLNTVGMSSRDKDWVYGGVSLNGGRFVACGIEWVGEKFRADIEMPDFLKENMMKVGYIVATRWDQDDFMKVFDHGLRVRVIEIKF